jgi:2-phospho-L-lactate guanylyltransferase (CobY/MobA/RfbA family)
MVLQLATANKSVNEYLPDRRGLGTNLLFLRYLAFRRFPFAYGVNSFRRALLLAAPTDAIEILARFVDGIGSARECQVSAQELVEVFALPLRFVGPQLSVGG